MVLLLCMMLMPVGVWAEGETEITINAGEIGSVASGTGWSYDASTSTLTLQEGYIFIVTGECNTIVHNNGTINGRTFNDPVTNSGTITNGTFKNIIYNNATISGGTLSNSRPMNGRAS